MFTITKSSGTYYEEYPVSVGILVRGDLAESWGLVGEIKTAAPEVPVFLCCLAGAADSSKSELHRFSRSTLIESHAVISAGTGINEIMHRSSSGKTCIIWSDMKDLSDSCLSPREVQDAVCVTPLIRDSLGKELPRVSVPYYSNKYLRFAAVQEGRNSLFPFDYTGLYDTPLFNSIGGFAQSFSNPFWQLADFGCRVFLWGHSIIHDDSLQVSYQKRVPVYDQSKDEDYIRWFRRNCSIQRRRDRLVFKKLFFHQRAAEEQGWVKQHLHRFMRSMEEVTALWDEL